MTCNVFHLTHFLPFEPDSKGILIDKLDFWYCCFSIEYSDDDHFFFFSSLAATKCVRRSVRFWCSGKRYKRNGRSEPIVWRRLLFPDWTLTLCQYRTTGRNQKTGWATATWSWCLPVVHARRPPLSMARKKPNNSRAKMPVKQTRRVSAIKKNWVSHLYPGT